MDAAVGEFDRDPWQIGSDVGQRVVDLLTRVAGSAEFGLAGESPFVPVTHVPSVPAWRAVNSKIRCQASVQAFSQSPKLWSKKECGAPS